MQEGFGDDGLGAAVWPIGGGFATEAALHLGRYSARQERNALPAREVVTDAMPALHGLSEQSTRRLCTPEMFVDYLRVEIERNTRYRRPFTIVLIQTPALDDTAVRLEATQAASAHALALVRSCDLVTSFESRGLVAAFLPETGPDGARTVFGRVSEEVAEPEAGWTVKMATYPEHFRVIDYFLERIAELVKTGEKREHAVSGGGHLWTAAPDVSASWRDVRREA